MQSIYYLKGKISEEKNWADLMISFTFLCEVQGFLKSDSKIALQVHSDAALISSATPQALEVIFLETLKANFDCFPKIWH